MKRPNEKTPNEENVVGKTFPSSTIYDDECKGQEHGELCKKALTNLT